MNNSFTYPKVLIVSHNSFSSTNNMGKTLASYFSGFPKECLAQLYFHEGVPQSNICNKYYSFSDKDALKSILNRYHVGYQYNDGCSEISNIKKTNGLYAVGKKKLPIALFARDLIWKLSNIKNKHLLQWVQKFNPDIIFFASGDYSFAYKIALFLSKALNIPLATCCLDDFYFYCNYKNKFLGKAYHRSFMKVVRKVIDYSKCIFVTNELMAEEYELFFRRKCSILYTPAEINKEEIKYEDREGIRYLGGLSLNRHESLLDISRMLEKISSKDERINCVDVYSNENSKEILRNFNMNNGIAFHGFADFSTVQEVIRNSLAVIHVEAFDDKCRQRTRLSLSTKIAESLASGTVLIAYGPLELASMQYLIKYNAAIVSDNIEDLSLKIQSFLLDKDNYEKISLNAKQLALKNHSLQEISKMLTDELNCAIKNKERRN